jgi:hypothetical protein
MSNALHEAMTSEAFLEREERQPTRFEFDDFNPHVMTWGFG